MQKNHPWHATLRARTGVQQKENGALEGNKYIVTWALGHLVTLKDPEDYDKKYKEWNMAVLPMMPEKLQIKVIPQTGKQYHAVTTQLARKDVNEIVIATDAGREGELVARWILDKAHNQKPCKRLWISSVTDKAIREGFANPEGMRKSTTISTALPFPVPRRTGSSASMRRER